MAESISSQNIHFTVLDAAKFSANIVAWALVNRTDENPNWRTEWKELWDREQAAQAKEFLWMVTDTEAREP